MPAILTKCAAFCGVILAVVGTFAPGSEANASDAELYGRSREVDSLVISPDGTQIAYLFTENGETSLVVQPIDGSGGIKVAGGELKLRYVEWSGPNHVLLFASETQGIYFYRSIDLEFWGVFSVDVRTGEIIQMLARNRALDFQGSLANVRAKTWDEDGTIYMAARTSKDGRRTPGVGVAGYAPGTVDLYEVDGNSGRGNRIAKGSENTDAWIVRPSGQVVARVDHFDKSDRYRILAPEGGMLGRSWEVIFSEETSVPNMTIYGTTSDEEDLVIGTRLTTDRYALFNMPVSNGKISDTALFEHEFVDISSVIKDEYTGNIVGAELVYAGREQEFFHSRFVAVRNAVKGAMPDSYRVFIESWDQSYERFVIYAESDTDSGIYLLLDVTDGDLRLLSRAYPEIGEEQLSPVRPFFYKTRDGFSLQGYLTIPKDAPEGPLPLVVMPHGGPESRDELGYNWWQQFIASRGYAIVQMNFRGSWGYGTGFSAAGFREWGGKMQDDVTDAVQHLIDDGWADPERICIVGGSYGGYAALAGAALTPDLYTCAASYSGVTDLREMLAWERDRYGRDSSRYEYWVSRIGEPSDELDQKSPAKIADNITADILLIHGKDDTVVDIEQSEIMAEALEEAGKPVTFVELDGEDHWLSSEETRIQMLELLDDFLMKNLGPGVNQPTRAALQ